MKKNRNSEIDIFSSPALGMKARVTKLQVYLPWVALCCSNEIHKVSNVITKGIYLPTKSGSQISTQHGAGILAMVMALLFIVS